MIIDKNKPVTWKKYKPSLCESCYSTCCTMPLEVKIDDLINMGLVTGSEDSSSFTKKRIQQIVKELQKAGFVKSFRVNSGLFLMNSRPNGDCQFLDINRKCSIYSKRPEVCRKFPESIGLRLGFCPYQRRKTNHS